MIKSLLELDMRVNKKLLSLSKKYPQMCGQYLVEMHKVLDWAEIQMVGHRVFGSQEWKLWEQEVQKRMLRHSKKHSKIYHGCWDTAESMECGIISEGHWHDFIAFVKTLK